MSKPGGGSGGSPGAGQPAPDGQDDRGQATDGRARCRADRDAEVELMAAQLAERTADLQRLQAEYANYRKRVERDRMAVREQALANVLTELLPVLDDIGRAREHGELSGGFKSVAESLEAAAVKLGLTSYGEDGDPFDPNLHEALMHSYSAGRDRADLRPASCSPATRSATGSCARRGWRSPSPASESETARTNERRRDRPAAAA